jgi:transcriptional regulator of acetoin/glycerol metabolism
VVSGVTGIAAPIFDEGDHVMGSLSLTVGRTGLTPAEVSEIATRVAFCAQVVSSALSVQEAGGLWPNAPLTPLHAEAVPAQAEDSQIAGPLSPAAPAAARRGKTVG